MAWSPELEERPIGVCVFPPVVRVFLFGTEMVGLRCCGDERWGVEAVSREEEVDLPGGEFT